MKREYVLEPAETNSQLLPPSREEKRPPRFVSGSLQLMIQADESSQSSSLSTPARKPFSIVRYLHRAWPLLRKRWPYLLLVLLLVGVGVFLRAKLWSNSPRPWGYVYDPYFKGIFTLHRTGELPSPDKEWQGIYPPLFYIIGATFLWWGAARIGR